MLCVCTMYCKTVNICKANRNKNLDGVWWRLWRVMWCYSDLSRVPRLRDSSRRQTKQFHIVLSTWVSDCISAGKLVNERHYQPSLECIFMHWQLIVSVILAVTMWDWVCYPVMTGVTLGVSIITLCSLSFVSSSSWISESCNIFTRHWY